MKTRTKIPKENKVRAELQKEIGSNCPFCENNDVGHFQIHHIDEDPGSNETSNLLLLCPICHSKITKGDIPQATVFKKKIELLSSHLPSSNEKSNKSVSFNSRVENAVVGDNNKITINKQKGIIKQKYPDGSIGYDSSKANYVSYLIDRYNEYKEFEVGKDNVRYGVFGAHLKKRYKIGSTRTVYNLPIDKFDDLVQYIQSRIDGTKLAKVLGKNHKNYPTFEEYLA